MTSGPEWVDGPPVPTRSLYVPGGSPNKPFRLRWPGFDRKNDPELVIDRDVFAATV